MNSLQFKNLCENDLVLLYTWFKEPTINQLYARNQAWSLKDIQKKYLPRILGQENVPSFIIIKNDKAIGFIQYYCLTGSLPEGIEGYTNPLFKAYTPNQLAGVDLFIAHAKDRGKGIGESIINSFISEYLTQFRAVLVDPNSNNIHAIRCYEKAGFVTSTFSQDPDYIVMIRALTPFS
ncbi:MAG: GNAT family N-acetyltransferase [Legionella sp.]|nr:GNAT family N-acetyltransferase [Legionella sp.]